MKPDILLVGPLMESVQESLEETYTVHRHWEADSPTAQLSELADTVTAVVTDGALGASRDLLSALPKVKIVTVYGVGVDSVDLAYCRENRIAVTNTPNVLSDDVADMAIGLMLATSRLLIVGDKHCRSGNWAKQGPLPLTSRMTGKRAGILGMGSIGLKLAAKLVAFDMDVNYCNRNKRSDANYRYYDNLLEMAAMVDFLIVTASATESTRNIVNANVLEAIGPNGYLINVSRGSLVDEAALTQALASGTIKAAGLDVFADEPIISPDLVNLDNVVLHPHHASGTLETRRAMGQLVLDNLKAYFSGSALKTEYFLAN